MDMDFSSYFKKNLGYYSIRKASDSDIKQWITVNGAHIPIREGQTKDEAVKEHIGEEGKKPPKESKAIKPEHVKELHAKATDAKKEIDDVADSIAKKYGVTVAKAPLKKAERIVEKAIKEYGGDLSRLKDVARNTVVTGHQYVENVLEDLKNMEGYVKDSHKNQTPDKFHGYSGNIINFKTKNGHVAEIQVNTPEMIYAKEKESDARGILGDELFNKIKDKIGMESGEGHHYYEVMRSHPEHSKEYKNASKKSHEYYNEVRERSKNLQFK